MAFSMHSHSGQFCPGHAKDSLEEVILAALTHGFQTFALTEHMPRTSEADLYPEEVDDGEALASMPARHEAYIQEALRLREKYSSQINILVGFEGEFIRSEYGPLVKTLASDERVDFFIGSVHHVHGTPIDYDKAMYVKARELSGGTDERLFSDYFDLQLEMLETLVPRVVGHFDLIRLLADEKDVDMASMAGVWERILRNLKVVVVQGGLLEVNSAGLRKGLKEPYPGRTICQEFLKMGGRLTLSDDSHGTEQVATNYERTIEYLKSLGVIEVFILEARDKEKRKREVGVKAVSMQIIKETFKC